MQILFPRDGSIACLRMGCLSNAQYRARHGIILLFAKSLTTKSGRVRPFADQAGTGQRTATRFIRIAIKDRLQVNALQSREQQRDDGDRLDHAKPLSGLIPHLSLPDPEKVRIAVTSHLKLFNKLYLYQRSTYGTGLNDTQLNWNDISSVTETYIPGDETVPIN